MRPISLRHGGHYEDVSPGRVFARMVTNIAKEGLIPGRMYDCSYCDNRSVFEGNYRLSGLTHPQGIASYWQQGHICYSVLPDIKI